MRAGAVYSVSVKSPGESAGVEIVVRQSPCHDIVLCLMGSQPMKPRLLAVVALMVWIASARTSQAVEPYLEFVQGLRDQGYYDFALLYLDQISAKDSTPAEIKEIVPFEKAKTLMDSSKSIRSAEKQIEQLTQANAFLEDFVKANPNHPSAGDANSFRGTILLSKGQAENMQAKSPSNQGGKRDFQNKAREYVKQARQVFQTAFDQHEAAFKKFPVFINQQNDPEQYAARSTVEQNLITTSLSLGMCTYEEAQSYDAGSAEFKQLLNKAAEEFEKMHQKYRSQVGGLHARAWQGKCYEEQNDLQKAMGIYNELLEHPGENAALSQLKTQTLYFKLICLNSKDRNDHQLVVDLAEEWIKKHPAELRTRLGLSIQWQQALAYETLGNNRELIKMEQERLWKLARNTATQIQKFPGEYKDAATSMLQRLQVNLGAKVKDPDNFELASGLAHQSFTAAMDLKKEYDDGVKVKRPKEELDKVNQDRVNELADAATYFELALKLVKPSDDKKSVATARLHYAYVNFWQRRNYEAAVLAQYVARTADKDDGSVALDAAYMAMAALVQAYNDNKIPQEQKGEDMRMIIKAANQITDRWPASDKANEAYMILGSMIGAQRKPAEAAAWFGKVPESDPKYPEAQLKAGQAYWTAYTGASRAVEKPTPEQLAAWKKSAEDHLLNGIAKLSKNLPKDAAPDELIAAKMSLSQIQLSQGKDADALKMLQDDPQSVVKAVTVADEATRKESGVTSRKFATETFKLVLRANIGLGNLDKAREAMKTLEVIAAAGGPDGGAEVNELYVDLGRKLKSELDVFRQNGEQERFDKLMTAFETFLNDMSSRKDQKFGTLSWLGETYFALGESVSADAAKSMAFYDKAGKAFEEILTQTKADQNFATAPQLYGVKLRQVRVYRLKKDYPAGETLLTEILKESPNNLKVQTEAAELYQDWGASGQADSVKKYLTAIQGNTKSGGNIWGWGMIASKLQKSPEFKTNPAYVDNFLNARYSGSSNRLKYAREQPAKDKQKHLEWCRQEITATVMVTKEMPEEWYAKFNTLYRDVLTEQGKVPEDLPRAVDVPDAAAKPEPTVEETTKAKEVADAKKEKEEKPAEKTIDMTTWAIFGACLVFGLGAIVWVLVKGKSKPKPKAFGNVAASAPVTFSGVTGGEALPPATFVAPKPKPRPASAGAASTGTSTGAKPAPKPAPAAGTATPKPRPKPPTPPGSK